ncbi:hypothetical protein AB0I10_15035 [Streptomyces sp. NPDC050636]|uniref:hypothetical protein n=1 Tax=Streptomyces sp. NPDC050636 TaxID=3154510 RepID=UPI0034259C41
MSRPGKPLPLVLLPPVLRAARTTPLLGAGLAAVLLVGIPAALSAHLRLTDGVLLMRVATVLIALGAAFMLDDPAARTTEVVPTPRLLLHGLRAFTAVITAGALWTAVLLLGRSAITGEERELLPEPGLALEAGALLLVVLMLASAGLKATAGIGGGLVAAPGAALLLLTAMLLPLPDGVALFPQPLTPEWGMSRQLWAGVAGIAVAVTGLLLREPRRQRSGRARHAARGLDEAGRPASRGQTANPGSSTNSVNSRRMPTRSSE